VLLGVAAALIVLAGASPALAAPRTLHDAAYDVMKGFMGKWDKDGFANVVDLGASKKYKVRLARCKIVVNPNLRDSAGNTPNAQYGPEPNVITFSKDPRKLKAGQRDAWGETVWHEVTHALEDANGDDQTNADKLYQERNTEYMTSVANEALPWLDQLEKKARAGASAADLAKMWDKFLEKMKYAAENLPETQKYPPDLAQMKKWFGFTADPAKIKTMYLTDKRFSGPAWANLRAALSAPVLKPSDWAGDWSGYHMPWGTLTLTVSGLSATGVWEYGDDNHDFRGAISADGTTMTGSWLQDTNLVAGPEHRTYSFSVTLTLQAATGYYVFDGFYWVEGGSGSRFQFSGSRK
jgi:hypothetical protein